MGNSATATSGFGASGTVNAFLPSAVRNNCSGIESKAVFGRQGGSDIAKDERYVALFKQLESERKSKEVLESQVCVTQCIVKVAIIQYYLCRWMN